jgi:hypothetical protein
MTRLTIVGPFGTTLCCVKHDDGTFWSDFLNREVTLADVLALGCLYPPGDRVTLTLKFEGEGEATPVP